jgi:ribosomal protein S1
MMILNNFIATIKRAFSYLKKRRWHKKLVKNIEKQKKEERQLPFKIIEIRTSGFLVKVSGLFAFISFNHMPWKYNDIDFWTAVSSKLTDKIFYCKIHLIKKHPLKITIDGKVHQFKKKEMEINEEYTAIIIKKLPSGVFVDAGYHFGWKYGSFVGFVHRSMFGTKDFLTDCSIGGELKVSYLGLNEKGQVVYQQATEPHDFIDQIVRASVIKKTEDEIDLLVNGRHKGVLFPLMEDYSEEYRKKIVEAVNNSPVIRCKVIGLCDDEKTLKLEWLAPAMEEIEMLPKNMIIDRLKEDDLRRITEFLHGKRSDTQ